MVVNQKRNEEFRSNQIWHDILDQHVVLSRREGTDLGLKSGVRGIESKCKLDRTPGQHWGRRSRTTDYGMQLRMKQMMRRYYGIMEKQFRSYFKAADQAKGSTGDNLLHLLESRLR